MKDVGKIIFELERELNINRAQMADNLGVTTQAISNWISRNSIAKKAKKKLIESYNVNFVYLETGERPIFRDELPIEIDYASIDKERKRLSESIFILANKLFHTVKEYDNLLRDPKDVRGGMTIEERVSGWSADDPIGVNMEAARRLLVNNPS